MDRSQPPGRRWRRITMNRRLTYNCVRDTVSSFPLQTDEYEIFEFREARLCGLARSVRTACGDCPNTSFSHRTTAKKVSRGCHSLRYRAANCERNSTSSQYNCPLRQNPAVSRKEDVIGSFESYDSGTCANKESSLMSEATDTHVRRRAPDTQQLTRTHHVCAMPCFACATKQTTN
jgi:hypothetical protein